MQPIDLFALTALETEKLSREEQHTNLGNEWMWHGVSSARTETKAEMRGIKLGKRRSNERRRETDEQAKEYWREGLSKCAVATSRSKKVEVATSR
jgi:hypothetical protein